MTRDSRIGIENTKIKILDKYAVVDSIAEKLQRRNIIYKFIEFQPSRRKIRIYVDFCQLSILCQRFGIPNGIALAWGDTACVWYISAKHERRHKITPHSAEFMERL